MKAQRVTLLGSVAMLYSRGYAKMRVVMKWQCRALCLPFLCLPSQPHHCHRHMYRFREFTLRLSWTAHVVYVRGLNAMWQARHASHARAFFLCQRCVVLPRPPQPWESCLYMRAI